MSERTPERGLSEDLHANVQRMIKRAAPAVSVEQLVKRGTKFIRFLSKEKIQELMEQAFRTVLAKYRKSGADVGDLEAEAKKDFRELFQQYQDAVRTKETLEKSRESLSGELDDMHRELDQQRRIAEGRLDEEAERLLVVGFREFEDELDHCVQKVFEKRRLILEGQGDPEALEDLARIEELLGGVIRRLVEAERARFQGRFARDRETAIMERRIAKLMDQMKAMENALRMISNQKLFSNQQIANMLRELGVAPDDMLAKKKKEMLKVVYDENVNLRKQITEMAGQGAPAG
ncbi:MAG: hypothetical protein ACYTAF_10660 [Planctomycetota bacterium]